MRVSELLYDGRTLALHVDKEVGSLLTFNCLIQSITQIEHLARIALMIGF